MLRSGRLTQIIELHRTVPNRPVPKQIGDKVRGDVLDEYGVPQVKASPRSARIPAEVIEARTAFEQSESGIRRNRQVTFKIRYLSDLLPDDLIIFDGREFRIVQIVEIGRRRGLEILTEGGKLARPQTVVSRNLDISGA